MGSLIEIVTKQAEAGNDLKKLSKTKTSFWASETETMAFDIFHRWIGTPATNPMEGQTVMMLQMRKLSEIAATSLMRKAGILVKRFSNDERVYFEWGPHKVPVSGYPDAGVMIDGGLALVEFKTYYGQHNHSQVSSGKVKLSYLKQLAIYLYAKQISHGILLMMNQGTGEMFEFDLYQQENPYHFICPDNTVEFNLKETFERWEKIYVDHIIPRQEPPIEFVYKYPVETLDWDTVSLGDISAARNGRKVLGDWQVKYSDYKDLIVQRQGTVPGYTDAEMAFILRTTKGYSRRGTPGMVRFEDGSEDLLADPIVIPRKPMIIK